jgi:Ser/Thr protein kinase RdoA (MazF antagonist)
MEADNMRWRDGMPTVFDCDDCAHYWFAADVAYALRDLYADRIERIDLEDPRLRAFVTGYRAVRPLPERDLRLLPLFMRAHNLYWFARLYRSIAEGEVPGEPPWATDLRATFVGMMNEFRDGFERHPVRQYVTDLPSRPRVPANPTLAALCCLAANRACLLVDPGARRLYHRR